jgi:hypothetical protein
MPRKHGITADTYKRFIIDAGAVYTGFTGFASLGTLLGATRGGSQLTIEQEIKDMEVDGARGVVKGGRRITMIKATLTVNFIEHTLANLKRALVGADSATFEVNWDAISRADFAVADGDFLSDITIVGEVSGDSDGMAIKLNNIIADGNFELTFADKEEGVIAMTFTAHFDPANLGSGNDVEPWTIFWPTES